jgi:hypothetical protein
MLIINKKRINCLGISLLLNLLIFGCVNLQGIQWESDPITGNVLGTYEQPNAYGESPILIAMKLDSGEMVLVHPFLKKTSIIKGQKLKLYRGTTYLGRKFYSLAPPSQYPSQYK